MLPLVLVLTLLASSAQAVTANLCVRNDGVGTFVGGDLSLFADSDWNAGDITGSGPGGSLGPGAGTCISMNGLYDWNGFQYQYVFETEWMDTLGLTAVYSPGNLQFTSSGSWYVSDLGITSFAPSTSSYISIANAAPPPFGSINSYANWPNDETECWVYWSGLTTAQIQDWNATSLKRASSPGGPWTEVYFTMSWGFTSIADGGLTPGTTYYYRVDTIDDYEALTEGPTTSCTTATAPGDDDDDIAPDDDDIAPDDDDIAPDDDDAAPDDDDAAPDDDDAGPDDDDIAPDDDDAAPDDDDAAPDDDDAAPDDDDVAPDDDDVGPDDDDVAPDDDDVAPDDDDSAGDDDDGTGLFEGDQPGDCTDRADNDQDGLFDCDDPDCLGSPDCDDDDLSRSDYAADCSCASFAPAPGRAALLLLVLGALLNLRRRR